MHKINQSLLNDEANGFSEAITFLARLLRRFLISASVSTTQLLAIKG